jgi:hypothetical protein
MKRLLKFVAAFAIAVLVAQPALASLPCTFGPSVTCAADCPMAMSGMGKDCPMTGSNSVAAADCPQNCCSHRVAQALAPLAEVQKLRLIALSAFLWSPAAAFQPDPAFAQQQPLRFRADPPPRYILNQVFRI